tara:strand:+ start:971 stop:1171 length:201 start_codon:yes stop_codon:yes gene_type:complete
MSEVDVAVSKKVKKGKTAMTGKKNPMSDAAKIKSLGDSMFGGIGGAMGMGTKLANKWKAKNSGKKD